ncbi:hypothetical protein ACINLE_17530 [Bacillus sp. z60-18]|uniref:hypothetical protein n=1 Tax=unclassified Bacillus (in: firmicutes) TaxID=185979 RepID=UPI00390C80C2
MNVEDKVKTLGLLPVDEDIIQQELKELEAINVDIEEAKHLLEDLEYYKGYGTSKVFYTKKYIDGTALDELQEKDKMNHELLNRHAAPIRKHFNPW